MLRRLLLLPGLHGTDALFDGVREHAPAHVELSSVEYPHAGAQDYATLATHVAARLPGGDAPYAIVAESFAGPLAVRLAASSPAGLSALILVNSFVASPLPIGASVAALLGVPLAGRFAMPERLLRARLLGPDAPDALVERVRATLRALPSDVLRARLQTVLRANETAAYLRTPIPIFYLRSDADRLVSGRPLAEMIRSRPGLQVHGMAGPHLLLQRHPAHAWEVLTRCLSDRG